MRIHQGKAQAVPARQIQRDGGQTVSDADRARQLRDDAIKACDGDKIQAFGWLSMVAVELANQIIELKRQEKRDDRHG